MTQREIQTLTPPEGVQFWQASSYRLPEEGSPGFVEAKPGAPWQLATPTDAYRPAGKRVEFKAGPHLDFLRLKGLMESDGEAFDEELVSFANKFGLLGLFHENYSAPILPNRKLWVAPEAVIGDDGELMQVDPVKEGTDLLLDLLDEQGYFDTEGSPYGSRREKREAARATKVAMPSEVKFLQKSFHGAWRGDPTGYGLGTTPVGWEKVKGSCGGLLVLTKYTSSRVGVLSTREHTDRWRTALLDFPFGDLRPEDKVLRAALNSRVSGVSPYSPQEEGEMDRGWRCSSLLEAMYLMLWLDMTGGRSVVKCRARGCPNWFRRGSQPNSIYCPHPDDPSMPSPCALREAKRESRRRKAEAARTGA